MAAMKTMVAYLVAALWALLFVGGVQAWSSSIRDGSAEASTLDSAARAIIRDEEVFEDRKHHQLQLWCNATVTAQTNRRSALSHLLVQSQSGSSGGTSTDSGAGSDLLQLEQQAAAIGTSLEQQRLAAQAAQSMQKQQIASLQLNMDDASKDAEALQRVWEHLGGAKASGQNAVAQAVARLLVEAKKTLKERQAKVAWVQAGEHSVDVANMTRLESNYRNKKAAILNFQHQYYATQRSLDVLSSALQDESAYLSDLQSICSVEKHVHERLETRVLPALRSIPKLVAAAPVAVEVSPAPPAPPAPPFKVPEPTAPTTTAKVFTPAPPAEPEAAAVVVTTPAPPPVHHPKKPRAHPLASKAKHKVAPKTVAAAVATPTSPPQPQPIHHHKQKKVHKAASSVQKGRKAAPAPSTTPVPPPASEDAELEVPTAAPTATPAAKKVKSKKAGKQKKVATAFLDGVYSSAAGNMPTTYTAWKPDADASTPSVVSSPTMDSARPTGPPVQSMKDLFDDKNDGNFDKDMKLLDTGASKHTPSAPKKTLAAQATVPPLPASAPAAEVTVPPLPTSAPADSDPLDSDETVAPVKIASKHKKKHTPSTTAAPSMDLDSNSDEVSNPPPPSTPSPASSQSMEQSADTSDVDASTIPVPRHQAPSVKKKLRGKKEDVFDDDDGNFEKDMKMLDTGSPKQTPAASEKASMAEATPAPPASPPSEAPSTVNMDASAAINDAVPTSAPHHHSHGAKKKLRGKKEESFLDGVYNAAAGNLPTAYAAWSPETSAPAATAPSQNAELKALEADFDSDDDAPTQAPKHRHKHHRHHGAPTTTPPPTHSVMKGDDGVVYDDDDLPKHHHNSFSGLEGGWQSFMKKNKKKAHAPKLDTDVAIMESLYTKDGGLPNQYTAWTPDSAPAAPKPEAPAKPKLIDDGDLQVAAKDFEKDDDSSFLQVASKHEPEDSMVASKHEPEDSMANLIHRAAASVDASSGKVFTSLLETASSDADQSGILAAGAVLDQFAEVLHSQPLRQLSKAQLGPSKLADLFRQLRNVDPLSHNANTGAPATHGKQTQAEQWCLYFQQHMESSIPMQQAVARVEAASNQLAKAVSQRAAMLEEVNARKQLQRTVEKDVESLTSLSKSEQQGQDSSRLHSLQQHLASRVAAGGAAAAVATAATGSHAGLEELQDLIEETLQKRTIVLKAQRQKLAELQVAMKSADADVALKKAEASSAQAGIEAARTKLSGIEASCDAALSSMERRRHAGHMEAHAIEVALQVLGNQ